MAVSRGWSVRQLDIHNAFLNGTLAETLYLLVYVDDILVMGSDLDRVSALVAKMAQKFNRYMKDVFKRAAMVDCKPVATPVSLTRVEASIFPYADPTQYRSLAGALHYLTVTRPDLSYAMNLLCQRMHAPSTYDWCLLKWVLRYVNGILHFGLHIWRSVSLDIHAFSDSDWASDPVDRKSTSDFAVYLGDNLVS
ncbi:uncharacterized protein LOC116024171 [Ipomoea triloba]|uniref:uncharacterized protein LOC116024171 n=1 Tax=Ipomoea triloba TaxID=35885 RepID=UPI00125D4D26|nr:uncharacterized protein LOC116024171 [Ipomoea triloba]